MLVDLIETLFSVSLFLNALLFIPQIITLYRKKNSNDVSLITFLGFAIIQFFAVCHGYINWDYRLMFGFLLSLVLCTVVCILIILYKPTRQKND